MGMKINNSLKTVPAIQNKEGLVQEQTRQQQTKEQTETMKGTVTKSKVKTTVEKMNDFIEPALSNLKFVYHEELEEYYVTVVDPLTKEVIKEIPPKKMLDMYAAMAEFMGILVDEKI